MANGNRDGVTGWLADLGISTQALYTTAICLVGLVFTMLASGTPMGWLFLAASVAFGAYRYNTLHKTQSAEEPTNPAIGATPSRAAVRERSSGQPSHYGVDTDSVDPITPSAPAPHQHS